MSDENHSPDRFVTFIGLVALLISCMAVTSFLTHQLRPHFIRQITTCQVERPNVQRERMIERRTLREHDSLRRYRFENEHRYRDGMRHRPPRRHFKCEKTPGRVHQYDNRVRTLRSVNRGPHTVILFQESELKTN